VICLGSVQASVLQHGPRPRKGVGAKRRFLSRWLVWWSSKARVLVSQLICAFNCHSHTHHNCHTKYLGFVPRYASMHAKHVTTKHGSGAGLWDAQSMLFTFLVLLPSLRRDSHFHLFICVAFGLVGYYRSVKKSGLFRRFAQRIV